MSFVAVGRSHAYSGPFDWHGDVTMRVVVSEFTSLDGVVQAPGGAEEDTSGGFRHGGWSMQFFDPEVMGGVISKFAERNSVLLQGRRTYQVSDTLTDGDLTWEPATIIRGDDLVSAVGALRDKPGDDIYVYGSVSVVR